jgi:ArsR family transcriptional regulator
MYGVAANSPQGVLGLLDALRDPTRVRLLRLLEDRELGVAELCEVMQLPQSTVSRHLKQLSDLGWLRSRRRGTTHLYRMHRDELEPRAQRLWAVVGGEIEGWATLEQDRVRLEALLARRRSSGRTFFDDAAHRWEAVRRELYGSGYAVAALAHLVGREWVVADLGCGNGEIAALLAERARRVIGVDQSEEMLREAAARAAGLEGLELRHGELESLPIEDGRCDAALILLGLSYVERPALAIEEMSRILRPGGRGVIVDLLRHDREDFQYETGQLHLGFAANELAEWLEASGLRSVDVRPLPPDPGVTGPALLLAAADRPGEQAPALERQDGRTR